MYASEALNEALFLAERTANDERGSNSQRSTESRTQLWIAKRESSWLLSIDRSTVNNKLNC